VAVGVLNNSFAAGQHSREQAAHRLRWRPGSLGQPSSQEPLTVSVQPKIHPQTTPLRAPASRRYQSPGYRAKKVLLGPALRTSALVHERISKRVALAVFSSDPISSTAYATEEILLVLVFAGAAATGLALPISVAIAGLLGILVLSYRQIIKAYSSSGGAYVVSRDNFGGLVASVAGSALIIDYILTVAVSVSAGTAALTSAFHVLEPWRVAIAVGFVVLLAWGNLRGLRESGRVFAVPTYLYVAGMAMVVLWGIWRWAFGGLGPIQYGPTEAPQLEGFGAALAPVSLFLVLHAFSAGVTALTGVEAISNGVSAFKEPQARNARTTLVGMAAIMAFLFMGITFLATRFDARPFADGNPTLVAQLARHVLGNPAAFIAIQVATLAILVLAANTSFSSFPLLASFAADDAILPRQLRKRGHRLVYSNGILVLSAAAIFLVIAFRADTHHLIPLYAIGVVTSFTLSQSGMARRHLRLREPGWRKGLLINGTGGVITLVVLVVIAVTKFADGAWMVCVAIPALVLLLQRVQRTYRAEITQLKVEASQRLAPPKPRHEVIVLLEDLDQAALAALQYARQLNPLSITALHIVVDPDHARELARLWAKVQIPIPLELVDAPDRNLPATVEETVAEMVRPDTEVTVLVPRRRYVGFWRRVLHDQTSAELTKVLGDLDNVNVTIVPYRLRRRSLQAVPPDSHKTAATRPPDRQPSS
jgi:amino acid transporter